MSTIHPFDYFSGLVQCAVYFVRCNEKVVATRQDHFAAAECSPWTQTSRSDAELFLSKFNLPPFVRPQKWHCRIKRKLGRVPRTSDFNPKRPRRFWALRAKSTSNSMLDPTNALISTAKRYVQSDFGACVQYVGCEGGTGRSFCQPCLVLTLTPFSSLHIAA